MEAYRLNKEELFRKFHTKVDGLTSKESKRRLEDFGTNEISGAKKKSYLKELCNFLQFFSK